VEPINVFTYRNLTRITEWRPLNADFEFESHARAQKHQVTIPITAKTASTRQQLEAIGTTGLNNSRINRTRNDSIQLPFFAVQVHASQGDEPTGKLREHNAYASINITTPSNSARHTLNGYSFGWRETVTSASRHRI
jgi:hypothetical protein